MTADAARSRTAQALSNRAWSAQDGALDVTVRVTPGASRTAIEGVAIRDDGSCVLKVRVHAPPQDGAANEALIRLIAKALQVPPRDVSLVAGAAARIKRLRIAGDGAQLASRLEQQVTGANGTP